MKIIILDFTDGKVKIVNLLVDKYNFKLSNIEFMITPDLETETLN